MAFELDDTTRTLIALARNEDLGTGDITSTLLPEMERREKFALVAREPVVVAGESVARAVLEAYGDDIELAWMADEGVLCGAAPTLIAEVTGPRGTVMSAERVLLNFLQRLMGIATLTRRYVDAVAGTNAVIMDTRKTTPGWRALEKYAVRCGGGRNHRFGLYDAVLIKDNHLAGLSPEALGGAVFHMLNRLSGRPSFVEVEVDDLAQFEALLSVVGIDVILLDNFTTDALRQAVGLRQSYGLAERLELEASGGVTLGTVADIARTGVDRISVGAITHSATAVDLALDSP